MVPPVSDPVRSDFSVKRQLTVERLSGTEALGSIAGEWEQLARDTAPRTPFTSPAYLTLWWTHFSRRQWHFRDEFYGHIVRSDDGRLFAVAPLMRTAAPGLGPRVLRMVQFFGADPALTEVRGVICRPQDHILAIEALIEHFLARPGEWDVFRWSGLHHTADAYNVPERSSALMARGELPDYIIELSGSWEDLRKRVSSNMRKNLRKAYELLERDGVEFALRVTERAEDVAAAAARFLALHAARADATDMIYHRNRFTEPHARAFIVNYLREVAQGGELRILELETRGDVVASRLGFLLGSDLYLYFAGYDPAWRAYSVMTVLMAETIKWAFAHGIKRINLSTGHDQSKLRWKPREVIFHDAVQVSPTPRARAAFAAFKTYEALSRARFTAELRGLLPRAKAAAYPVSNPLGYAQGHDGL